MIIEISTNESFFVSSFFIQSTTTWSSVYNANDYFFYSLNISTVIHYSTLFNCYHHLIHHIKFQGFFFHIQGHSSSTLVLPSYKCELITLQFNVYSFFHIDQVSNEAMTLSGCESKTQQLTNNWQTGNDNARIDSPLSGETISMFQTIPRFLGHH